MLRVCDGRENRKRDLSERLVCGTDVYSAQRACCVRFCLVAARTVRIAAKQRLSRHFNGGAALRCPTVTGLLFFFSLNDSPSVISSDSQVV